MLVIYRAQGSPDAEGRVRLEPDILGPNDSIPNDALWIDMVEPTPKEDGKVEQHLGVYIPTREDMSDIEPSELLYTENNVRYLTMRLFHNVEADLPEIAGVGFILRDNVLVTVRYVRPLAFQMFTNRCARGQVPTPEAILAGLIEAIIDRAADVLQASGERIDAVSHRVFHVKHEPGSRNEEYQENLRSLGRQGDLLSKVRECLVSIERVLLFLTVAYRTARVPLALREEVRTTLRDLQSLEEHATFLTQKIQFLLDATLGLVNLEQNNLIKLFSVMAVIFMPPTLIASIYGMNFKNMPELDTAWGYPAALVAMVAAGLFPYLFFRWKKWL